MITVRLTGGLGNQMFQYAAAFALARRRATQVRLDLHFYASGGDGGVHRRPFDLSLLNVGPLKISRGPSALVDRMRSKAAERLGPKAARLLDVYVERGPAFEPAVLQLSGRALLVGYFQSARYFADAADSMRAAFQPKDRSVIDKVRVGLGALRRSGRSLVSVHVRRGDYLAVRPDGGLLVSAARLRSAMEGFTDANFLVFSDDLAWCEQNIGGARVATSPFRAAIEDLTAMSMCDHHIIANSSFSWWGAWLNTSAEKRVVAPMNWFGDGEISLLDIYAPGWKYY